MGLDAIKAATRELHTRAERSGVVADIVAGRATRLGVALLLRNLLPVYQVLDESPFGHPALARAGAIEADLRVLAPDVDLPLLPQGVAYAERVRTTETGLVAHAYVRYLGDLNGGAVLGRRLRSCLGAVGGGLGFLSFPGISDRPGFTREYRAGLDRVVRGGELAPVVQEALIAFDLNIALSEAVKVSVAV